ncbi:delta-1-pyrroline-5-carboxylate dehydrogenase 12A1, mitochondrial, partial [Tanacetum coccineum]
MEKSLLQFQKLMKVESRVAPKSYQQAFVEVYVTGKFLENFSGDQVAVITPLNFPLEIHILQLMGSLYIRNKLVLKVDSKVCIVMEQMLRLLHDYGMPLDDVD